MTYRLRAIACPCGCGTHAFVIIHATEPRRTPIVTFTHEATAIARAVCADMNALHPNRRPLRLVPRRTR